jgi:hypothetical protein
MKPKAVKKNRSSKSNAAVSGNGSASKEVTQTTPTVLVRTETVAAQPVAAAKSLPKTVAADTGSSSKEATQTTPAVPVRTETVAARPVAVAKSLPKSEPVKPPQPQDAVTTTIAAKIDVGLGNSLFIRGQGNGLSWERGTPLHCVDASTWLFATTGAKDRLVFKLLLNDQTWSQGEDLTVEAGKRIEVVPVF